MVGVGGSAAATISQYILAPLAFACSNSSSTNTPEASPITKPSCLYHRADWLWPDRHFSRHGLIALNPPTPASLIHRLASPGNNDIGLAES